MLATARPNQFSIFIRKIGFSVGLEYTLDRLRDFAKLYASKDTFSFGDVNRLLHSPKPSGWNLEKSNEHVLDVLKSLGVVAVFKGEVSVLELGEALGILRRLQADHEFERSLRFLFAHALVLADGDIFLNALASSFDALEFKERASRMLEYKWHVLEEAFPAANLKPSIFQAVNIEAQSTNPGSRGHGIGGKLPFQSQAELSRRTGPLQSTLERPTPNITDAYLRKALPRRKAWAASLDLIDETGSPSQDGAFFLDMLVEAGFTGPNCLAIWPLEPELASPTLKKIVSSNLSIYSSWDFLVLIGRALKLYKGVRSTTARDLNTGADLIINLLATYRSLNTSKRILRKELPGRVAYRCALALGIGSDYALNLPEIAEQEQRNLRPRFFVRRSNFAEIAIS